MHLYRNSCHCISSLNRLTFVLDCISSIMSPDLVLRVVELTRATAARWLTICISSSAWVCHKRYRLRMRATTEVDSRMRRVDSKGLVVLEVRSLADLFGRRVGFQCGERISYKRAHKMSCSGCRWTGQQVSTLCCAQTFIMRCIKQRSSVRRDPSLRTSKQDW